MITLKINHRTVPPLMLELQRTALDGVRNVADELNDLLRKGIERNGGDARLFDKLLRKSMALTDMLLTPEQQHQLSSLPAGSALTVTAPLAEHRIPWELLRVGNEFHGERFAVGRVVSDVVVNTEMPAAIQSVSAAVLVAEAFELVSTNTERTIVERRLRQLSHDFPELLHLTSMQAGPLTRSGFCQMLEESRWLHFAGHATEVVGQRVLSLHESPDRSAAISVVEQLTPTDLQDLCCAPEVVFLNACGALQLPQDENGIPLSSFVSEFLRLGTKWLLGPVVPVLDSQTRHFTTEFYDAILQGCSMGEAIRRARLAARRVLGPHNLLPLSYVLYGDPSMSPFPVRTTMNAMKTGAGTLEFLPMLHDYPNEGGLLRRTGLQTRPDLSDLSFPFTCSQCGQIIETHHGVGNASAVSLGGPAVCCDCHRNRAGRSTHGPDVPRGTSLPQKWAEPEDSSAISKASANPGLKAIATSPAVHQQPVTENPAFVIFQRHLDECLNRVCEWTDIQTGKHRSCTFRRNEKKPVAVKRAHLESLDADRQKGQTTWSANYTVIDPNGQGLADVRLLVPGFTVNADSKPITHVTLTHLLAGLDAIDSRAPQIVFVCSLSGFDSALLQNLSADADPLWYHPGRTVYLHDIGNNQTHFRMTDLNAHRLVHLLQRESTGRQFQQAVQWIESQLPLVTSLGRNEIVDSLNVESDAAEAAIRHVASLRQLQLDETLDFGLVLSERSPTACRTLSVPKPTSLTYWGKVAAVLLWPLRAVSRGLRWLIPSRHA